MTECMESKMIWITLIVDDVMISSQFVQGFADPAGIWRHPHARSAITIKQQMPRIVRLRTLLPGDLSHGFHNSFNLVRDRDAVPYSTRFSDVAFQIPALLCIQQ